MDNIRDGKSLAEQATAGEAIRFVQRKTSAKVAVYPAPQLISRLTDIEARRKAKRLETGVVLLDANVVLYEATGRPYNEHTFSHTFADVRELAASGSKQHALLPCPSIAEKRFQDLRDTAVTWLARAGCTIPEIASITGHSLRSIHNVLAHYLELGEPLAKGASEKLNGWMKEQSIHI
jgi:hypothetical protein